MPAFKKALVVAISSTLLHGCLNFDFGDDDDDDSTSNPPEASTNFSGKVADGYLAGARVCLDLNSNKICDPGEPSTISTAGGEFSLDDVTQAQLDSAPLLVEIIVGETVDEDKPDTPIEKKYTLTAPAGYEFISPLTTMVQSEIEENGASPEEAEGAVQAKLGTTIDLEADYVAGQEDGNEDAEEFERLHKVAQVTVVVLQENIELVEEVLGDAEVSFEDLVAIIVQEVVTSLDTIAEQVDTAIETEEGGGDAFDPTELAESDELDVVDVDTTTIEEEIEERETAREIAAANIAEVLAGGEGIHFFDADHDYDSESQQETLEYYYGTVMKDAASALVTITETFYNPLTQLWELDEEGEEGSGEEQPSDEDDRDGRICLLSDGTVSCVEEERETISISGDAVIVEMGGIAATRQEITGVSVDLAGKNILTFMDDEYFRAMDPMANFSEGATGYKLSFKRPNALYAVFDQNVETVSQCWDGDIQENENNAWTPTDTLCNNVFLRTGDGEHNTDGQPALALADLITPTAAVSPTDASDIKGVAVGGHHGFEIIAEFVEGGTLNYYLFKHPCYDCNDEGSTDGGMGDGTGESTGDGTAGEQPPVEEENKLQAIEEGTGEEQPNMEDPSQPQNEPGMDMPMLEAMVSAQWQETTVAGQTIIEYGIPPLFAELGDLRDDERLRFFVAYQGAVRQGGIHAAGEESDNEWVFNDEGRDQIKAAFDFSLTTPLEPCMAGDVEMKEDDLQQFPGASYAQFKEVANTDCDATAFVAGDITDSTLVTDFGFLSFHSDGTGTFLGEVGRDEKAVLDFAWAINGDGYVVVNAQTSFEVPVIPDGVEVEGDLEDIDLEDLLAELDPALIDSLEFETLTVFLRLTLAKVEQNTRQVSVKTFNQEAATEAELDAANGAIFGEVWGIN